MATGTSLRPCPCPMADTSGTDENGHGANYRLGAPLPLGEAWTWTAPEAGRLIVTDVAGRVLEARDANAGQQLEWPAQAVTVAVYVTDRGQRQTEARHALSDSADKKIYTLSTWGEPPNHARTSHARQRPVVQGGNRQAVDKPCWPRVLGTGRGAPWAAPRGDAGPCGGQHAVVRGALGEAADRFSRVARKSCFAGM